MSLCKLNDQLYLLLNNSTDQSDSCFALQGPPGRKVCTEIAGVIVIYIALLIITLYLNQVGTVQRQILRSVRSNDSNDSNDNVQWGYIEALKIWD